MAKSDSPLLRDYASKLTRLHEVAIATDVNVIVLRQQGSLAWLFGARSHVPYTLDRTWFDAVVDFSGDDVRVTIVVNTIEATRLQDTELADYPVEWKVIGWWEGRSTILPTGPDAGSDVPGNGMKDISSALAEVRRTLTDLQVASLSQVCADSAFIASGLATRINPNMTETHVAGMITAELLDRQMDPITVLVAGGERMMRHRHPLPTNRCLGERATLVFCGRRGGLISAVTRIVSFGPLSSKERDVYQRLLEVEADFFDASEVGNSIGKAFTAGIEGYVKCGFGRNEWHNHHQGGFSGWESREFPAHHGSTELIKANSVIAWNPSADGFKSEDTIVVTEHGTNPLVKDQFWPTIQVRGRPRPAVLEL